MMARWGAPMMPRQYEDLAELAREQDTILVANPGLLPARLIQVLLASLLLHLHRYRVARRPQS